ncbi:hypothetical protein NP493_115g05038 [Ridgeia piscesae]|uniref:Secreted protein n=1 Tax=Ridgeia piscesae TaxID=27915 RepID=A0AAD9UH13_RIDPI|nr:hypothetical protein NP493_115g05038 [Ridgeia piscesae]
MPTKCVLCVQLTLLVLVVSSYRDGVTSFSARPRMPSTLGNMLHILRQERSSRIALAHAPLLKSYRLESHVYMRSKKSSVAWLMAAALRMCQKYPDKCLYMDS